jgi:outer membrane receptor protein involved in Fe transport
VFYIQSKNGLKAALLVGAATAAALSVTASAFADDTVETVVVTGSRIPNRDYMSDSPISTVSAENLQTTGALEVTDIFQSLPQVVPSFSSGSNNPPSNGEQKVDLRGLGPNRNVVLMDGRRIAPSDDDGTVDLQTIPQALISRVEVITGGASAVYGADAITGVVNFIMKDDFSGVALDAKYGISGKGDNIENAESAAIGGNFADGKGNAVLSYDYAYRKPIFDNARAFADQATTQTSYFPNGTYRPNSSNLPTQASVDNYFLGTGSGYAAYNGTVGTQNTNAISFNNPTSFQGLDGSLFSTGGGPGTNGPGGVYNYHSDPTFPAKLFCADPSSHSTCATYSYNFQPPNLLVVPLQRHNFMAMVHYDIEPNITAYMNAKFTEYSSDSSLAPSPAPTSPVTAPDGSSCGFAYCVPDGEAGNFNPFIPTALQTILATRTGNSSLVGTGATEDIQMRTRFLQAGPRLQIQSNDMFQVTGGVRGSFGSGYTFDVYASYGQLDRLDVQQGNISNSAVENLLYGLGSGNCTGYGGLDLFGANESTQAALTCVERETKNYTKTTFTDIEGSVEGSLFPLPAGDAKFSIGADYREQTYSFLPDPLLISGDISGFNASNPISGATYQKEGFGELYLPLIKDAPFAENASITLGGRFTNQSHTLHGNAFTWKAEGDWGIAHGITLRGSYQVATRMPNINELFGASAQNNPTLADPCDANGPFRLGANGAQVAALCAAQAAAAGASNYVQPTGQIQAKSHGTANLKPETADTYTLGVAWVSDLDGPWLSGLSATVDYWNIDLHSPVGIDFFDILYGCFNIDGSNPTYSNSNHNCQHIIRSPGTGSVSYLSANEANLSKNKLDGIDVAVNWALDLHDTIDADPAYGTLGFQFAGTYLSAFKVQGTPGGLTINYAGTIGATSPIGLTTDAALPKYKAQLTAAWAIPQAFDIGDATLTTRISYIDAMKNDLDLVGWAGKPFGVGTVTGVPATWYVDLFGSIDVSKNITLRAGILNLGNQQPRIYNPSQQDGTDPSVYDIVGRRFFGGVSVKF